jgi:hypothetical protein
MAVKLGTSSVTLKLGTQSVTGYLGSAIVTASVPGAPTILLTYTEIPFDAGVVFQIPGDGGSPITSYTFYINGVEAEPIVGPFEGGPGELIAVFDYELGAGQDIEVAAVNAVGEGPKSAPASFE